MAITAGAGYMVDPNNPNSVIPIGSQSTVNNPNSGYNFTGSTATTTPAVKAPTPVAPTPQPAPSVTINTAPQPIQPTQTQAPQPTAQNALSMPPTGSVVDLLNAAGQSSDYQSRQQLAQQYGIQGYTGTAAQNQDLAKKFLDAYNAKKSSPVPQTSADARGEMNQYFQDNPKQAQEDPQKTFMDAFSAMNPIEANLYQQLSTLLSSNQNRQSMVDLYKNEISAQGIPELNMELADINRIMNGTEDDIRDEVSKSGGFATESQVQALASARNKTLLKRASYLSDVINAKNEYVDRIVELTGADRNQASQELDRKLGITNTLISMSQDMTRNAKENYMNIVSSVGWGGLAATLKDNPTQLKRVENLLGLAPGELSALATYKKPLTEEEDLRLQNLRLQNQKIAADLKTGPSIQTQVVDVGGKKLLINSKTGATIKELGSGDTPASFKNLALAQSNIESVDSLLKDPNIKSAVGPNPAARFSFTNWVTGGKSSYIAGVEQLRSNLTLDNLVNAKANGATFGALSEGELGLLQSSASKLGTWAIKDSNQNVVGYKASETDFKAELDKINNFAKLDFILKGGSPEAVGARQMADGTIWVQNSDGSKTQLK